MCKDIKQICQHEKRLKTVLVDYFFLNMTDTMYIEKVKKREKMH